MSTYIVSYDLLKNKDYTSLIDAIKTFPHWGKVLESCWIVVTQKSAKEVRDFLLTKMDSDDRIFVLKSWREAAWENVICKDQWLKDNL